MKNENVIFFKDQEIESIPAKIFFWIQPKFPSSLRDDQSGFYVLVRIFGLQQLDETLFRNQPIIQPFMLKEKKKKKGWGRREQAKKFSYQMSGLWAFLSGPSLTMSIFQSQQKLSLSCVCVSIDDLQTTEQERGCLRCCMNCKINGERKRGRSICSLHEVLARYGLFLLLKICIDIIKKLNRIKAL